MIGKTTKGMLQNVIQALNKGNSQFDEPRKKKIKLYIYIYIHTHGFD